MSEPLRTETSRTPEPARASGHAMLGLQSWIALPLAQEETAPSFQHFDAGAIYVGVYAAAAIESHAFGDILCQQHRTVHVYVV